MRQTRFITTITTVTSGSNHIHIPLRNKSNQSTSFIVSKYNYNYSRNNNGKSTCTIRSLSSISNMNNRHNINEALQILNLQHKPHYTNFDLRDAYFAAAKLCHPDSKNSNKNRDNNDVDDGNSTIQFLKVTEAYELLLTVSKTKHNQNYKNTNSYNHDDLDPNYIIPKSDEENYRTACQEFLGVDAETVEESKRCPLFREWLKGRTDAAYHWNRFFMVNGGLAPMLNGKKVLRVTDGGSGSSDGTHCFGVIRRRKRK